MSNSRVVRIVASALGAGALAAIFFLLNADEDLPSATSVTPEQSTSPEVGASERPELGQSPRPDGAQDTRVAEVESVEAVESFEPQAEKRVLETRNQRALKLKTIDVFAYALDGTPLLQALGDELGALELGTAASVDPFDRRLSPSGNPHKVGAGAARAVGAASPDGQIGRLELLAKPPLWVALVLGRQVLATKAITGDDTRVDFRLDPELVKRGLGSLTFQVFDGATNRPIPAAPILITAEAPKAFRSETADKRGRVVLDPWYAGSSRAMVWSEGSGWQWFEFETLPGERTDAGRVELWPAQEVVGIIVDEDGQALEDIQVQAFDGAFPVSQLVGRSNEQGEFSYRLRPGTWYFQAYPPAELQGSAFRLGRAIVGRDTAPPPVRLQLVQAAPLILEASDDWARLATFRVSVPDEGVVRIGDLIPEPVWRDKLPLGPYDVELLGPSGEVLQRLEIEHKAPGTRIVLDRL